MRIWWLVQSYNPAPGVRPPETAFLPREVRSTTPSVDDTTRNDQSDQPNASTPPNKAQTEAVDGPVVADAAEPPAAEQSEAGE